MGRIVGGSALLLLAAFMAIGFMGADVDASAPATLAAVLVVVVLPAVAGLTLLVRRPGARNAHARRESLRRETVESEVLRLAAQHGARLTVVEVVSALGVSTDAAEEALNALAARDLAEVQVTNSGVIVYMFRDIALLGEKPHARGVLDD